MASISLTKRPMHLLARRRGPHLSQFLIFSGSQLTTTTTTITRTTAPQHRCQGYFFCKLYRNSPNAVFCDDTDVCRAVKNAECHLELYGFRRMSRKWATKQPTHTEAVLVVMTNPVSCFVEALPLLREFMRLRHSRRCVSVGTYSLPAWHGRIVPSDAAPQQRLRGNVVFTGAKLTQAAS